MPPLGLVSRLKSWVVHSESKVPPIWPRTAALFSILYTLLYIAPFYLSKVTRPSPTIYRDAPSVIRARIRSTLLATAVNTLLTLYVISTYGKTSLAEAFRLMGYAPISFVDIGRVLLLCAILFAGPLFEVGLAEGQWRSWANGSALVESFTTLGPLTEELIWRALVIPLHLLAVPPKSTDKHHSYVSMVFITPLYFGLAHLHHLYEFKLTHPRVPITVALVRSLFQFGYTSLFGFFASFVFLRTGNVWACVAAHSFCNAMGLPRFWGRVEGLEPEPELMGPPVMDNSLQGEDDTLPHLAARGALSVWWTVAYYVILVAGAIGFYRALYPLTESRYALVAL